MRFIKFLLLFFLVFDFGIQQYNYNYIDPYENLNSFAKYLCVNRTKFGYKKDTKLIMTGLNWGNDNGGYTLEVNYPIWCGEYPVFEGDY